jgi:hypothetical protein
MSVTLPCGHTSRRLDANEDIVETSLCLAVGKLIGTNRQKIGTTKTIYILNNMKQSIRIFVNITDISSDYSS